MKIGIISDTHGIFREEWHRHLDSCDYLIHAGDFCTQKIMTVSGTLAFRFIWSAATMTAATGQKIFLNFYSSALAAKLFSWFIISLSFHLT